jgi:hypothetical protein
MSLRPTTGPEPWGKAHLGSSLECAKVGTFMPFFRTEPGGNGPRSGARRLSIATYPSQVKTWHRRVTLRVPLSLTRYNPSSVVAQTYGVVIPAWAGRRMQAIRHKKMWAK